VERNKKKNPHSFSLFLSPFRVYKVLLARCLQRAEEGEEEKRGKVKILFSSSAF
jgi:hypothetical protein